MSINKTIRKKERGASAADAVLAQPTGFAGEHFIPEHASAMEADAAVREMADEIEAQIASGTLSKAQVRLLRNRLSAARSRFRKRHFVGLLENQLEKLSAEKDALSAELQAQKILTDKAAQDAANLRTMLQTLMPAEDNIIQATAPLPVAPMDNPVSIAPAAVVGAESSASRVASPAPVPVRAPSSAPAPAAGAKGSSDDVLDFLLAGWNPSEAPADAVPQSLGSPVTPLAAESDADWIQTYMSVVGPSF